MAETRESGSRPDVPQQQRRESSSSERTPRQMRRDLFDLSGHRLMRRMHDSFDRFFGNSREWPAFFSDTTHMDWTPAIDVFGENLRHPDFDSDQSVNHELVRI